MLKWVAAPLSIITLGAFGANYWAGKEYGYQLAVELPKTSLTSYLASPGSHTILPQFHWVKKKTECHLPSDVYVGRPSGSDQRLTVSADVAKTYSTYATLRKLQQTRSLHGINFRNRLDFFKTSRDYTALDMDVFYDQESKQLLVKHDNYSPGAPRFEAWMDEIMQLPLEKRKVIKIDMKNIDAVEPVIAVLESLMQEHPDSSQMTFVLHRDIDGDDMTMNKENRANIEAFHKLGATFPNAVLSLGGVTRSWTDEADSKDILMFQRALDAIGGDNVKTVSFHYSTKVSAEALRSFEQRNAFATLWSRHSHGFCSAKDGEEDRQDIDVPDEFKDKVWLEY